MVEDIIPAYKWKKMDTITILASIEIAVNVLEEKLLGAREKEMIKYLIERLLKLLV